jgi:hypothetical protein
MNGLDTGFFVRFLLGRSMRHWGRKERVLKRRRSPMIKYLSVLILQSGCKV